LFSYQIFLQVKPQPSVELLLKTALVQSEIRAEALDIAMAASSSGK
jgi:hypothetical protein